MAISLVFLALVSFSSCGHSNAQKEYNKIRTLIRGHELVNYRIGEEEAGFLKSVRESWHTHEKECPDPIFSEVLETAEFEVSVSGVVNFHTHQIPEYSSSDSKQNLREGIRAATIGVARSESLDGRIYFKEGLCFIKLSEKALEVFEDQDGKLSRTLYVELNK
ncbi:hypothetical protein N9B32_01285 [Akkermansiaceae bacterium]|nr:hypothetical protein [Akkermansiaceae bacterium]MDB4374932.1 hypothetical protein [bacterium]MDA7659838.1 hypothetical protein [Akkermansiaceae bacterium]MDA7913712.1 hypothetical protein [Akkermansiaceae bacterium]MDA7927641.1 hypothetical protein [Akkermansiaceae bacterium]